MLRKSYLVHMWALILSFGCANAQAQIALGAIETRILGSARPASVGEVRRLQSAKTAQTMSLVQTAALEPGEIPALTDAQPSNVILKRLVKTAWTLFAYDVYTSLVVPNVDFKLFPLRHKVNSGGHIHDLDPRPKGDLSAYVGNTGPSGYIGLQYTSPDVSGTVYSDLSCTGPNGFACFAGQFYSFTTMVPGLQNLGGDLTYDLIGATSTHTSNHWATSSFADKLRSLANLYFLKYDGLTQPKLAINDLSLEQGGLFDIKANWATPHREHRIGVVGDLRTVPVQRIAALKQLLRDVGIVGPVLIHSPPDPAHWHIREFSTQE